jgi:Na+-driven multidrug efflux pump
LADATRRVALTRREASVLLLRLAWPIAVTGQLAMLAEAINIYWLGRLLGDEALAVEATLRPVVQCIGWILVSIATGVSVLVAQSVGARDGGGLTYIKSGIRLVIAASIALAVLVLPLAAPLARWLAPPGIQPEDLRAFGLPAVLLMLPGLALVQVLLNAAAGAGWTRLATVRMAIDLCATALVVPLFVGVLGLGLAGAPLAQACVQAALFVWVWRALYAQRARWHLEGATPAVPERPYRQIIAVGLPLQIARIVTFASYTYLVQRIADDGHAPVVGFGVALLFLFFAATLMTAVGRAVGIAYGQAIGANNGSRAQVVMRTGLVLGTFAGVVVAATIYVLADPLVSVLARDPSTQALGVDALHILALAVVPLGSALVYMFVHAAVKASRRAALVSITADLLGLVYVWLGPSDALTAAAWSICVSNTLRVALYALSSRTVIRR